VLRRQEEDGLIVHALIGEVCDWEQHAVGEFVEEHQLAHSLAGSLEEMPSRCHRRAPRVCNPCSRRATGRIPSRPRQQLLILAESIGYVAFDLPKARRFEYFGW
jgi:hypothetical protein